MRILHTSDWHLGKYLENQSRIEEQEKIIEDIIRVADEKEVDLVIIAGDIYDNSNPSARAEKLLYKSLKSLGKAGERVVVVIAGNHDNPERLMASTPLAYEHGIILLGSPNSRASKGRVGKHEILDAGEGYMELKVNDEKIIILTLPYPSEQRLNEALGDISDEKELQKNYSEKVGQILSNISKKFRPDTINIAVSHIFVLGGETSDSERPLQVGGGLTVDGNKLSIGAQYIALGHLHKPQRINNKEVKAYYSGSPLQYSKSEIGYSKCVYIIDVKAGEEAKLEEVLLKNRKPIEIWRCDGIDEAIDMCEKNKDRDVWAYLEIKTDEALGQSKIKDIKKIKPDILSITPIFEEVEKDDEELEALKEKNIIELFREFYMKEKKIEPTEEFMALFTEIAGEE
ncbi:metallophosphoesterase family protein [Paramaledivibacter caminithermalis]|jgi:exonuclease SbcD|uniref:Nuclease SbcCD subunit D n=1 Tax=Paramaledivibacter caminithermalis (strain DSM 15212 / CIP 107654 / DViRD3) TaxID=1121301 RepID=A0A1M6PRN2_PARC5|nr:exonuclease SbcCD subunit D C-terminal domain-containing protein [Paramaledivibacter caminithermalis]SHK10541.1 Exodeoxyribonuclease I subunit D [Paramaledivibacter caminithermalis DSM 15212]